jgi:hypothetical protein
MSVPPGKEKRELPRIVDSIAHPLTKGTLPKGYNTALGQFVGEIHDLRAEKARRRTKRGDLRSRPLALTRLGLSA